METPNAINGETLGALTDAELHRRAQEMGLAWHVGPYVVRLRTPLPELVDQITFLYAGYPLADAEGFVDHEVSVRPHAIFRNQAYIIADGSVIYDAIDRKITVPLLEWTLNLCVFHQPSRDLVLHAAVVEQGGRALIMPAVPGSGKSTLCAALVHRDWRLLSDEVAIIRREDGLVVPATRPIGLKEESIAVIRAFASEAVIGPSWPGTPKGTVAHCLPPADSVTRANETAQPAWIVFPEYRSGASTSLTPISKARALIGAGADSFNYSVMGTHGFQELSGLIDKCDCYELNYSDLDEAVAALKEMTTSTTKIAARIEQPDQPLARGIETCAPTESSSIQPTSPRELALQVFSAPHLMKKLDMREWDSLIRISRRETLLSRLAVEVDRLGFEEVVPERVRRHLDAARGLAVQHHRVAMWEVNRIRRALRSLETPVIFLKGAAYVLAGLDIARGRLTTDVDILARPDALPEIERALESWDWEAYEENPCDEQYYREWLHELPPLVHKQRGTMLDVHHTILPRTDRLKVRPELLFDEAIPFEEGEEQFLVLSPPDMLLHAAVHLFRNGDFSKGFRDLLDLAGMLAEFSARENFWEDLLRRAEQLDLTGPCYYTLRYTQQYLGSEVPSAINASVRSFRPAWPPLSLMDALVDSALLPRSLDRIDRKRNRAVSMLARLYLPKLRVAASPSFWTKRFPILLGRSPESRSKTP